MAALNSNSPTCFPRSLLRLSRVTTSSSWTCRKVIHREPAIELIGVDPHRFAEVRGLGLINEQIDWKQRFFIPTDEETGIAVLTELLARYPVLASDVLSEDEPPEIEPQQSARPQIVDLDEWFVPIATDEPTGEPESPIATIARDIEEAEFGLTLPAFYFARRADVQRDVEEIQLALDFG